MDVTFEKLCKVFLLKEPFYGIILSSFRKEEDRRISTIGICPDGSTFRLKYNPDFLKPLKNETVMELLKHEMEHICFNHPFMGNETGYCKENMKLFNIACDLECNSYLDRNIMEGTNGCWAEDFGLAKYKSAKWYYRELKAQQEQQEQKQQNKDDAKPCNGGAGDNGQDEEDEREDDEDSNAGGQNDNKDDGNNDNNTSGSGDTSEKEDENPYNDTFDTHEEWGELSEEEQARTQLCVKQIIVTAAESVEKSYSADSIPEPMRIIVNKLREKAKPVTDWRRYCRRFMGNEYSYLTKKSRRRESLRFPDMAGTRHQRNSRILVAIDTSGSVSMSEYMEFMQQIMTMRNNISFDIAECDTQICHFYPFKGEINTHLHGGGGTSFQPPVDLYYKDGKYDCLIYFTDGGAPIPANTPKDTLWVISSLGSKNNNYTINGAKVIFIPQKQ